MVLRSILTVFLFVGSCSLFDEDLVPPEAEPQFREAAWVYANVFDAPETREHLVRTAKAGGFDTVYLSVYRPTENGLGHRMYDDDAVADVILRAHEEGIEVWAAYGNGDWPELGAQAGSFPYERFAEIAAYNRSHPVAPFDGIMLDVEPPEPADMASMLGFYREALTELESFDIKGAVAVRHFWKKPVTDPSSRKKRAAYQAFIDLPFDHVVVMGYRNFAGEPCIDNGLICLNEDYIRYAHRSGRKRHIIVGLRTTSLETDAGDLVETFHGYPSSYVEAEKLRVAAFFRRYAGFGGFATHRLDVHGPASLVWDSKGEVDSAGSLSSR